jgi:hypothetical protein
MKDKKVLVGIIAVAVLLLAAGGFFFISRNAATEEEEFGEYEEELPSLSPEEVGLEMEALRGNQQVIFRLTKPDGITSVEYELTYFAEDGQQRAVIGTVEEEDFGGDSIESKPLDLGSCSSGVCKYDKGVKEVNLMLTVTKDGKNYQVKDNLGLE